MRYCNHRCPPHPLHPLAPEIREIIPPLNLTIPTPYMGTVDVDVGVGAEAYLGAVDDEVDGYALVAGWSLNRNITFRQMGNDTI